MSEMICRPWIVDGQNLQTQTRMNLTNELNVVMQGEDPDM